MKTLNLNTMEKKISFIESPAEVEQVDLSLVRGGISASSYDCNGHCTHCSGSSSNSKDAHFEYSIC